MNNLLIKKYLISSVSVILMMLFIYVSPADAVSRILVPKLDIAQDLSITKIFDMNMGSIIGLNSNNPTTHTGSLTLNTSHIISKENLTSVSHYASGTSGKVRLRSEAGFIITLWVDQPSSVGSFNSNIFWSDPRCKIVREDDATVIQAETDCGDGSNLVVTTSDGISYIYI